MLVLAMNESSGPVMSKDIAAKQNLPATYLEQLMLALRKGGLVNSTRGAKGGYILSRDPSQIQLAQIVESLEGPIDIADCSDVPNCVLDPQCCALKEIYERANNALRKVFEETTLSELAEMQTTKSNLTSEMYYI